MAFLKRTWLARLGTGLNKFLIGDKGADGKQTLTNSPDTVVQEGDVISAENLNDLEDRIDDEFGNVSEDITAMKLTKVWDNPNPSALEFAEQIITIQGEVDDIILEYRWTSIYDCSSFVHFKTALTSSVGAGFSLKDTGIESPEEGSVDNVSIVKIWSRNVHFYIANGSTKLEFKDCIQFYQRSNGNSGFGVGNSRLVPVAIYKVGDIYNS